VHPGIIEVLLITRRDYSIILWWRDRNGGIKNYMISWVLNIWSSVLKIIESMNGIRCMRHIWDQSGRGSFPNKEYDLENKGKLFDDGFNFIWPVFNDNEYIVSVLMRENIKMDGIFFNEAHLEGSDFSTAGWKVRSEFGHVVFLKCVQPFFWGMFWTRSENCTCPRKNGLNPVFVKNNGISGFYYFGHIFSETQYFVGNRKIFSV